MYLQKNLLISLTLVSLISNLAFADSSVSFIKKGDVATYDGYLFTIPKAEELRNITIERNSFKLLNESLNKSVELQDNLIKLDEQKVNKLLEQNDKLAVSLNDARTTSEWTKLLWFFTGIAVTGVAFYGVNRLAK